MNEPRYTSQEPGLKLVFVAVILAAILGLSFRLYFSPNRVKSLIEAELERRPSPVRLEFERAEFSLARGAIPQIALRLVKVAGQSIHSCSQSPGFTISEVFVPFKILSLLQGRIALGVIHGANLEVDLDALKDRCPLAATVDGAASLPASEPATAAITPVPAASLRPWWSADEWEKVSQLISGVSLEKLTLKIEKGKKAIYFEDLLLRADLEPQALSLNTEVRIPPELLFGQTLPTFVLEATAHADSADIEVRGNLGEGALMGLAQVKAVPGDVAIDAHLNVNQVPLSSLMSYLKNFHFPIEGFKPKFLWLNCEASINGHAKGLFKKNPVTLERCSVTGDAGQIVMEKGEVGPGQAFSPLVIDVVKIDVKKILAMFGTEGPSAIMSKYGQVAGRLDLQAADDIIFDGRLLASEFLFSSQAVQLGQKVPELKGKIGFRKGVWSVGINEAVIDGGGFKGTASVEVDSKSKRGEVKLAIDELALHPEIQKLVVRGTVKNLSMEGDGSIEEGRLRTFKGRIDLSDYVTDYFEVPSARLTLNLDGAKATGKIFAGTAKVRRESKLQNIIAPALFARQFTSDWIRLSDFTADVSLRDRLFSWEKARLLVPDGNMILKSRGSVNDHDDVTGILESEDARFRKMRWKVDGNFFKPTLTADEATRQAIQGFKNQKKN